MPDCSGCLATSCTFAYAVSGWLVHAVDLACVRVALVCSNSSLAGIYGAHVMCM